MISILCILARRKNQSKSPLMRQIEHQIVPGNYFTQWSLSKLVKIMTSTLMLTKILSSECPRVIISKKEMLSLMFSFQKICLVQNHKKQPHIVLQLSHVQFNLNQLVIVDQLELLLNLHLYLHPQHRLLMKTMMTTMTKTIMMRRMMSTMMRN